MDTQTLLRLAIRLRPYVDMATSADGGITRNVPVPEILAADLIRETGCADGSSAINNLADEIRARPDWHDLLEVAVANADMKERVVVPHATYVRFCPFMGKEIVGGRDLGDGRFEVMLTTDSVRDACDAADEPDFVKAVEILMDRASRTQVEYQMSPALAQSFLEEYPQYADSVGPDGVFRGVVTDEVAKRAGYSSREDCAAEVGRRIRQVEEAMRRTEGALDRLGVVRGKLLTPPEPLTVGTDAAARVRKVWAATPEVQNISILAPEADQPTYEFSAAAAKRLVAFDRRFEWLIEYRGDRAVVGRQLFDDAVRRAGFTHRGEVVERLTAAMRVIEEELNELREENTPATLINGGHILDWRKRK